MGSARLIVKLKMRLQRKLKGALPVAVERDLAVVEL
jgi:hypothetical protein